MDVLVVDHPLAKTRLTAMRDERTDSGAFRAALHELTTMLVYEAARSVAIDKYIIQTPVAPTDGYRVANPPLLVPVLRAGLGMSDAALALLPESSMGFVGLARDEETFAPRAYLESLPSDLTGVPVMVLDPDAGHRRLAGALRATLVERGCTDITVVCVLAAPEGIARLDAVGPSDAPGNRRDRRAAQRAGVHRAGPGRRRRPPVRRHAPLLTAICAAQCGIRSVDGDRDAGERGVPGERGVDRSPLCGTQMPSQSGVRFHAASARQAPPQAH